MKRPTEKEIQAEIVKLEDLLTKVPQFTAFNDDNHASIDAQIRILEGEDIDLVENELLEENDQRSIDCINDAYSWLEGNRSAPSEDWEPLAK